MLCKEAVIEWKTIYEKKTGKNIETEKATEKANIMFGLLKEITKSSSLDKINNMKRGV